MILNDNSTQQINTLVIQLQNRITNLTNELKSLNKEASNLDSKISDLERRVSSNTNDAIADAAAMNAQIQANTKAIRGKADRSHNHTKSDITDFPSSLKNPNALTINGKTYDGSTAVDAGVQTVENGGTGKTTANDAANSFINSLTVGTDVPVDDDYYVCQFAGGGTNTTTYHRRPVSKLWNYIKGKADSVYAKLSHTHTKSQITDFPSSLPANGGTADRARNMYYQNLDLSELDKTKFYPLVCISYTDFAEVAIFSESGRISMEYNQNRIHFDISAQGWSDTPFTLNIREYACYQNEEITIGCIGRGTHNGAWAIWLRGGLHYACFSRDSNLSLHTSDYTFVDETYTVGTNYYGGSNTNVKVVFTPQSTITDGAYSNRPITAPNITSLEQRVAALESKI